MMRISDEALGVIGLIGWILILISFILELIWS